jgi:hypothetical protein
MNTNPIVYKVYINGTYHYDISVPKENELIIPTNFFYEEISKHTNTSINQIAITNAPKNQMMCLSNNENRYLLVKI